MLVVNQPHFKDSAVETITFFSQIDGDIYPDKELPENAFETSYGAEMKG
jgi:hypothetical protein